MPCEFWAFASDGLGYSMFQILEYGFESMSPASLLPQDVVVLVKLLSYAERRPSLARMAADLFLSGSQVHAALNRLAAARLILKDARRSRPNKSAAEEFLVHGAKYMFPAIRGGVIRGMLTSYAAPPLDRQISSGTDLPPVWPFAMGQHRGVSLEPLYRTVPWLRARTLTSTSCWPCWTRYGTAAHESEPSPSVRS